MATATAEPQAEQTEHLLPDDKRKRPHVHQGGTFKIQAGKHNEMVGYRVFDPNGRMTEYKAPPHAEQKELERKLYQQAGKEGRVEKVYVEYGAVGTNCPNGDVFDSHLDLDVLHNHPPVSIKFLRLTGRTEDLTRVVEATAKASKAEAKLKRSLEAMNLKELRQHAEAEEIDTSKLTTKEELIRAILGA